ncbi:MAG: hypothetical protein JXC36_06770 [Candidatus Atribacteria bacterium]|nr:hypothetical protein [Candidatus Atribacteria bacterium]
MNSTLFIINTEYHLLNALIVVLKDSKPEKEYVFLFVKQGNRFVKSYNIPFKTVIIPNEFGSPYLFGKRFNIKKFYQENLKNIDVVYCFVDNEFINTYFINRLKKEGSEIRLIQEGLNAYIKTYKNISLRKKINREIKYYLFKYILGYNCIQKFKEWGSNPNVDKIYLLSPEKGRNKVHKLDISVNSDQLKKVETYLNIENSNIDQIENSIIFFSQGFFTAKIREKELIILKQVAQLAESQNKKFYLKLHPREKMDTAEALVKLKGVKLLDGGIPSELILLKTKRSIVFSWYSASLLFYVDTNAYFWAYPLLFDNLNIPDHLFPYIKRINSNEQLRLMIKNN